MRHAHGILAAAIGALALAACESNPPLGPAEHDDELVVDLTLSASHVHTLSPITYTVSVRDDHGPVTDFQTIRVERLAEGTDTWRGTDLTRNGAAYEGSYTFASSGGYTLRIVGQRPGQAEEAVLHTMPEAIQVARAHVETGGYRVEFESYPGHVHEGDQAEMKFWILETEVNAAGVRPPVAGLHAEILCAEENGFTEEHHATESGPGVYEATHMFMGHGHSTAGIGFPGADGSAAVAEFEFEVSSNH